MSFDRLMADTLSYSVAVSLGLASTLRQLLIQLSRSAFSNIIFLGDGSTEETCPEFGLVGQVAAADIATPQHPVSLSLVV